MSGRASAAGDRPAVVRSSPAWRRWLGWLSVLLISLYPSRFLAGSALWATLDGQAHVFRALALEQALAEGVWYPRWLPDLLYGYGYPLFNFYAPLTYYLALPFRLLGLSHVASLEALTAAAFGVAGLSAYALAREYLDPLGSLVAAVAYVYWPYRFVVVYIRGDLPEALALALLPFALWAFVRVERVKTRGALALAALAFAMVICAHNVTAALFTPILAATIGVPALAKRSPSSLLAPALAFAAGLGLAAFFWMPALWETRWLHTRRLFVGDYLGSLVSPQALLQPVHWAYHYYPDTGNPEITFPPGFLALLVMLPGVAGALRPKADARLRVVLLGALLLVALSLAGMLRPLAPLLGWLQVIQAPYRLLGLAALGGAILTGAATLWLSRLPLAWRTCVVLVVVGLLASSATFRLSPARRAAPGHLDLADLYVHEATWRFPGTTWAGEFMPRWATADPFRLLEPAPHESGGERPSIPVNTFVSVESWTALGRQLHVESSGELVLALHSTYVPGWRAMVDGRPAAVEPLGPLGLVGASVPPGQHAVRFDFGSTTARSLATVVSALTALAVILAPLPASWLASSQAREGRRRREIAWAARVLGVSGCILVAAVVSGQWGGWTTGSAEPFRPLRVALGGEIQLAGVRFPSEAQPGAALPVTLYWLSLAPASQDYKVFVHLVDSNGRKLAQEDSLPVHGSGRTSAWWPGELTEDRHVLRLPPGASPGEYYLVAGLYDGKTGARPSASAVDPRVSATILDGNSAMLGSVTIRR